MRRLAFLVASVSALFVLAPGCSSSKKGQPFEGKTLRVLNWDNYIDVELLRRFEERTGAKVVYDTYASDDELEEKLAEGDEQGYRTTLRYIVTRYPSSRFAAAAQADLGADAGGP